MPTRVDLAALRREAETALRHYAEFDERVAREDPDWVPRGDHIRNWYKRDDENLIVLLDIAEAANAAGSWPRETRTATIWGWERRRYGGNVSFA